MKHYIEIVFQHGPDNSSRVIAKGNGATKETATAAASQDYADTPDGPTGPDTLAELIEDRGLGNGEFQIHIWTYEIQV